MNKKDLQKNAFNDLFSTTRLESIPKPIEEEKKEEKELIKSETKKEDIKHQENIITKRKTYNIPIDIVENMEKIVYMDRDIKDNTDLLIIALRKYLDSKTCKDLLMEYDKLKGIK